MTPTAPVTSGIAKLKSLVTAPPADELSVIADRIRARIRRTTTDIIATGNDLIIVKAKLAHGDFLPWIEAEFGMTDRTARNYMQAAEWATDKSETVSDLQPSTLYRLASPSTPQKIRDEALADLGAGKVVDADKIDMKIRAELYREREAKRKAEMATRRAQKRATTARTPRGQRAREAEEYAEKIDRAHREAAERAMAILKKLAPEDARELLTILLSNGYGTHTIVQKAQRMLVAEVEVAA